MSRINVYVPDDLAERARDAGLNVSSLTQAAIASELDRIAAESWLIDIPAGSSTVTHDDVTRVLDESRDEMGDGA